MSASLLNDILVHLEVAEHRASGEIVCWCPFHADGQGKAPHHPNLVIKPGTRGAAYIWACPVCNIGGTLLQLADRLREAGIMPPREAQSNNKITATYDYVDENGLLLYQVVRRQGKNFKHRIPDGNDGWIEKEGCMDGVRHILYHLPELLAARPDVWVFVPEGEKDVDTLAALPLVATTNSGGARKWRAEFGPYFRDRWVAILPDNDVAGREHAEDVASKLVAHAKGVCIVELPDLLPGGDVSDWLAQGHTLEELGKVVEAAPTWSPDSKRVEQPNQEPTAILVTLSDVERLEVDWVWKPGRIPKGRLVMIDGDPGVGKSWLTLAIATPITTGRSLPGDSTEREPSKVLLLTAEDGLADTVRPRLEDMGADLSRVRILTAVQDEHGNQRHPSLADDLAALDEALSEGGYALVIIDPINAYLGSQLDTHRDAALRSVLAGLATLAERWGGAILCVRHLTKGSRDKAIYRGQGNIAYTAAARVVFLVGENPDDPRERVLACIKNNLAPLPPSLAFELTDAQFLWRGTTDVTPAALLRPDAEEGERGAQTEAQNFLRDLLADGPIEVKRAEEERREAGIAERTLRRARVTLGVKSERQGGLGSKGNWAWVLPKAANPTKAANFSHTVIMAPLDRLDIKVGPPLGHLSNPKESPPTKAATRPYTENLATLDEPIKERSPLVRLALDLGAKVVEP